MYYLKKFVFGEIKTYMKDYKNLRNRDDISAKEFTDVIKEHFPEYGFNIVQTTGWNRDKEYDLVESVFITRKDRKKNQLVMINKSFIVIKVATETEEGLIIGIHDFNNFKAIIEKIDPTLEYMDE